MEIGFGLGYRVTDEGFRHLQGMTGLKHLRLDGCQVSNAGLKMIGKFQQLDRLGLKDGSMTDDGLASLSSLQHLRH